MKSLCNSLLIGLVVGVVAMLPIGKAYCQSSPEPAVIISIAKFEDQMNDVDYLLTASGFGQMKFMANAMVKGYIKGLDAAKDAGVLLYFTKDSQQPDFLGFVPVTSMEEMLDVIYGMAEVDEGDEYTTIIADNGTEFFLKEYDGYAFFSNNKEKLESLPESPADLLKGLSSKYNLSARVYVQRIPKEMRGFVLETIRESSEMTLSTLDDDDLQADLQRKNLEMQMRQMEMMLNESDTLTIGMSADKDAKMLSMDVEFKGLPNSELAAKLAAGARKQGSRFIGFCVPGATFTLNQCVNLDKDDAKVYSTMLDDLAKTAIKELDADGEMAQEEIDVVEKELNNLVDVAKATLKDGVFDSGAVLMLDDGNINFAAGVQIADPKTFESTVKELANLAETKMGEKIEVNLNSGSHKDITLHTIVVNVPEQEEIRMVVGEKFTLVVGIGDKAVYLGAGSDPVATLIKAIDGPEKMVKFIKSMPIFKALDKDNDNLFSKTEIEAAVAAYQSLDGNSDSKIEMNEMMPDAAQTTGFVRSLPIFKAIDKDNNGVLAESEIEGAVGALESIDSNGDGKITIEEMMVLTDLMQMNFYLSPMLAFSANVADTPPVKAMADALKDSGGDRIRGTYNLVENGGIMHFEMQDGILGLIKVGFDAFSQGGGGFPGANDDF